MESKRKERKIKILEIIKKINEQTADADLIERKKKANLLGSSHVTVHVCACVYSHSKAQQKGTGEQVDEVEVLINYIFGIAGAMVIGETESSVLSHVSHSLKFNLSSFYTIPVCFMKF